MHQKFCYFMDGFFICKKSIFQFPRIALQGVSMLENSISPFLVIQKEGGNICHVPCFLAAANNIAGSFPGVCGGGVTRTTATHKNL